MSHEEKKLNKKKVLLIIFISFFFLLIFALWLSNFLRIIDSSSLTLVPKEKSEEVSEIKESFKDFIEQVNKVKDEQEVNLAEEIKTLDEIVVKPNEPIEITEPATDEDLLNKEIIKNCPAYVNCMPMIDSVVNCSIPFGCEGVTQFVY